MARDLSTDVENEKDKDANKPIEIYQIHLDENTLYLADYTEDIEFFDEDGNPQTYFAASLKRDSINTDVETKVDSCTVEIDNVDLSMSAYSDDTEFVDRKLVIWKVFRDHLDNFENKIVLFEGLMDAPRISQHAMSVQVTSKLDTLDKDLPRGYYQIHCRFEFGDPETCGKDVPEVNNTVDNIDGLIVYDDKITQADNFWKYGAITIGTETRIIESSSDGQVKVEFPFDKAQVGDDYTLKAGCDKTMDGSHGCKRWNNQQFYGGFLSIPRIRDVREFG